MRGILLVDENKNTLLIPWDSIELSDMIRNNIKYTKTHKTLKELYEDIRLYTKGLYTGNTQ